MLITLLSCHHPWSAQGASGTPGLLPSSEWDLWMGLPMVRGVWLSAQSRAGGGSPQPVPSPIKSSPSAALLLVGAAKRTWTMTRRRIPWCLPSVSGHAEEMAPSTVRLPCPPIPVTPQLPLALSWVGPVNQQSPLFPPATRLNGTAKGERRREPGGYDSSSTLMSSELETTSFFDSDEDDSTSRWAVCDPGSGGQVSPEMPGPAHRCGSGVVVRAGPAWWGTTMGPTGSAAPRNRAAPHA